MLLGRPTARATQLHARALRLTGGRLRRSWMLAAGQPVIALTTTGRRTHAPRTTTVAALVHGGTVATVGMNLGLPHDPAWTLNLAAHPLAWAEAGGRRFAVRARLAAGEERRALWQRWLEVQPSATVFAELAGRDIPVFVLDPA